MQSTQCVSCKHFITDGFCRAFLPHPIPKLVLQGWIVHNHEIDGDHGLQYQAASTDDASNSSNHTLAG